MGITAILQIADQLLNGFQQQVASPGKTAASKPLLETPNPATAGGDTFTPSQQTGTANTASEAGIFQLEQFNFTTLNIGTAGVPAPAAAAATTPIATAVAPQAVPAPNVAGPVPVTNAAQSAVPAAAPAVPVNTTTVNATPESTQNSLQTLNTALAALGLNPAEIQAFDQFASVILQFDPNGLQILQAQLNALAAQFSSATAAVPGAAISTNSTNTLNRSNAPGFQLNGLSISFAAPTASSAGSFAGNTNANAQSPPFLLQISEIQISLAGANGQTLQLSSAQPTPLSQNSARPAVPLGQAAVA